MQKSNAAAPSLQQLEGQEGMKSFSPPQFKFTTDSNDAGSDAPSAPGSGEMLLSTEEESASGAATSQMMVAGTTESFAQAPTQKKDPPKSYLQRKVIVTKEMSQDEFKEHALQSLFGGKVPSNVNWEYLKPSYGPKDSPVTINVDVSLIKQQRASNNSDKGIKVDETGRIDGAAQRSDDFNNAEPTKDKTDLMAEIDRRYYEATGYNPGEKIKNTPGDQGKQDLWKQIQDEVLYQNEYIKSLSPRLQQLLVYRTGGKKLEASDLEQLFRIAKKLEYLTEDQFREYLSRATNSTTDLGAFESSVDSFKKEKDEQAATAAKNGTTSFHESINDQANGTEVEKDPEEWSTLDLTTWKTVGGTEFLNNKKWLFVYDFRNAIAAAATRFDIPPLLLSGVCYVEFGGDPLWIDDIAYGVRKFDHSGDPLMRPLTITKDEDLTSFGNVSMQVRRAAETMGYDPKALTGDQKSSIIDTLKDPKANIFLAAAHLRDLKKIDFPDKTAADMTLEDIKVTATRYNRGPDLSLDKIKQNMSYGEYILKKADDLNLIMNSVKK